MTDKRPIRRNLDLTEHDVELILDAVRVLDELDHVRPSEMTGLFYAMQYDNLRVVVEDLLVVLGVSDR